MPLSLVNGDGSLGSPPGSRVEKRSWKLAQARPSSHPDNCDNRRSWSSRSSPSWPNTLQKSIAAPGWVDTRFCRQPTKSAPSHTSSVPRRRRRLPCRSEKKNGAEVSRSIRTRRLNRLRNRLGRNQPALGPTTISCEHAGCQACRNEAMAHRKEPCSLRYLRARRCQNRPPLLRNAPGEAAAVSCWWSDVMPGQDSVFFGSERT